jgi:hypothetical protein
MTRDNFQALFAKVPATKTDNSHNVNESSHPPPVAATSEEVAPNVQSSNTDILHNDCNQSSSNPCCDNNSSQPLQRESTSSPHPNTESTQENSHATPQENNNSKPGTESISYLKRRFLSLAPTSVVQNIRELKLSERMNALAENLEEYPDRLLGNINALESKNYREKKKLAHDDDDVRNIGECNSSASENDSTLKKQQSDNNAMEEECQKMKLQSEIMCNQIGRGYDALVRFVQDHPHGTYQDFIQYLKEDSNFNSCYDDDGLGTTTESGDYNMHAADSPFRKLWNDNLTLGLDNGEYTTLDGRMFVAAREDLPSLNVEECTDESSQNVDQRPRTTISGERIKQLSQIDGQKIASSAFSVLSNVSSLAMKPLRDLQLAEKVNAMQLDVEEEETRREIERYNLRMEEQRDLEDMIRLKKEAEERTLTLTKDHLVEFLEKRPDASYTEWIEDLVRFGLYFDILCAVSIPG